MSPRAEVANLGSRNGNFRNKYPMTARAAQGDASDSLLNLYMD